jgi:nucleoside-diphosphate-sugar epimerase
MRVLFIGGTGNLSAPCSRRALAEGIQLTLLNRGRRADDIPGAETLVADLQDEAAVARALGERTFDAVANFIAFDVPDVERDLRLFAGRCGQYLFVSSASCYRKPWLRPIAEDQTPLYNPFWDYSQRKIRCEERLGRARADGSPVGAITIVRPSLTYDTVIPLPLASWTQWTAVDRMIRGAPIVVPGDGCSPWTVTHGDDFAVGLVGLLGNPAAFGQAFHITGDQLLTWDEIHHLVGAAVGVEPRIVHMASEDIAALAPERAGSLLGDKAHAMVFDNTKIKRAVPEFQQGIPFADGIRRTVAWFRADARRQVIDPTGDALIERLLAAHRALRSPPPSAGGGGE